MRLLEAVGEHPGGTTAKYLARRTGIALPTTYHLLRTLAHEGYVEKLGDGSYIVGDGVDGLHASSRGQVLRNRVRAVMADLREELGAAIYLARYHDGEVQVSDIVDSRRAPRVDVWADFRDAAHATAIGKCLLSGMSRQQRADHFSRYPPAGLTPRTFTRVRDLVDGARTSSIVLDSEEYSSAWRAWRLRSGSAVDPRRSRFPSPSNDFRFPVSSSVRSPTRRGGSPECSRWPEIFPPRGEFQRVRRSAQSVCEIPWLVRCRECGKASPAGRGDQCAAPVAEAVLETGSPARRR
ncbi:IclR family transcriptional regulator [Saccharopolyspora spinosporotrichia]